MIGKVQGVMSAMAAIGSADKVGAAKKKNDAPSAKDSRIVPEKVAETKKEEPWSAISKVREENQKAEDPKEPPSERSVSLLTKELNEIMDKINCDLKFRYHKEVDLMSVQMINKKTDEVLKEFPPEDMIENMSKAKEWIGAFIDRNA